MLSKISLYILNDLWLFVQLFMANELVLLSRNIFYHKEKKYSFTGDTKKTISSLFFHTHILYALYELT